MCVYVYAIVPPGAAQFPPIPGILGEAVYSLSHGELAAIVSNCPVATVRAERRHILASQQVITALNAQTDLLPMAFGTVAGSRETLCAFLDEHREVLLAQLQRVAGRIEMSLKLRLEAPDPIAYLVASTPALRAARDRVFAGHRAPSQDERIRLGQLCEAALRRYREAHTDALLAGLGPCHAETCPLPLHEDGDIAHLAVLVPRDGVGRFEAAVEAAAALLPDNLAVTIGGPWPPHNFVRLDF